MQYIEDTRFNCVQNSIYRGAKMTSLQPLGGGGCNNDNNSNLLLLQASPVVSNNGQIINPSLHSNPQSDSLSSQHIIHDQNNMSHMNGYQVN